MMTTRKQGLQRALQQRGQALLLALLVLGVAGGAALFSYYRPSTLTLESDQKTTDALALVKTALIGWTVKRGDVCITYAGGWVTCSGDQRPGEFPCPDTDNDGNAEGSCVAGRLGRVPWKTLGIPEPKDSAGETLWYAVAGPFRKSNDNPDPLNSDTRGNITVYAADGSTLLADGSTNQNPKGAVAVIFAPGPALGNQNRDPNTTAACTTSPSSPVARNRCAFNYLETGGTTPRNNATTNGPFINGQLSPNYNDRVVYLTTPEFMPSVEKRVATEVKAWLDGYRANSACQCYPWAASFSISIGNAAKPSYDTPSSTGRNRGRFPVGDALPENWSGPTRPILSSWFTYNNWNTVIYYALAMQNAENRGLSPTLCTTCTGPTLTVDGKAVISAIFFTPGTPLGALPRPHNTLDNYLEDAANMDGANDTYITPTATALNRDRIYTSVSAPAAWDASQQCEPMGKALRKLAPCGAPPKLNPVCVALAGSPSSPGPPPTPATGLAACPACANAAQVLINVPCQTALRLSVCRNAYRTLDEC